MGSLNEQEELELLSLEEEELELEEQEAKGLNFVPGEGEYKSRPMRPLPDMKNASPLATAISSGARGMSHNLSDDLGGVIEGVGQYAGVKGLTSGNIEFGRDTDFKKNFEQGRENIRQRNIALERANPKTAAISEMVGGAIGSAALPFLNIAKGSKLATTAGKSGLGAGIAGAGNTNFDDAPETVKAALSNFGLGALLGGAGHTAGRVLLPNSSELLRKANQASAKAIGSERGSIKKLARAVDDGDMAAGMRRLENVGKYAREEGILSPSAETMLLRNAQTARKAASDRRQVYDLIDSADASTFSPIDEAVKLESKYYTGLNRVDPQSILPNHKEMTDVLDNRVYELVRRSLNGNDTLPLAEANKLVMDIGKNIFDKTKPQDANKLAKSIYFDLRAAVNKASEEGAQSIGIKGLGEKVKRANYLMHQSQNAGEMLGNKFAREAGNKLFSLTDVIAGAGGVAAGKPLKGLAIIGAKKAGERYGNYALAKGFGAVGESVAGVTDILSKTLNTNPEMLGRFAGVLRNAAQRGSQALAVSNYLLHQNEPEYREIMKNLQSEGDEQDY